MGPSVKFVSAIIDAFSNNKMGVSMKNPNEGEDKDKDKEHINVAPWGCKWMR